MESLKKLYVKSTNFIACAFMAPKDFNDVLVIRLDELGDFVLWLDSAKEYRKIFPNKKITLLVNEKWAVLARTICYWDEVIGINTLRFRFDPLYRIKWLRYIRNMNFETTVSPRYFIQGLLEPAIIRVCGSENRIVYGGYFPLDVPTTIRVKQRYGTIHELTRNADFIRALGVKDFKENVPKINLGSNKNFQYYVMCPYSYRADKNWPESNFLWIRSRIMMPCFYIRKKMHLLEFINVIAGAKFVIGNDSGPIHLAAALGVPSVCVGIGKHGAMFHPYPEELSGVIPCGIFKNVKSITIAEVWKKIGEINVRR